MTTNETKTTTVQGDDVVRGGVVVLSVCDHIAIDAWQTEGMVLAVRRPAAFGSADAIEVLVQTGPDDDRPRWYRVEPNEYRVTMLG